MTHGNQYNLECPHCGRTNHNVGRGLVSRNLDSTFHFRAVCFHCDSEYWCTARWEVVITAEAHRPAHLEEMGDEWRVY